MSSSSLLLIDASSCAHSDRICSSGVPAAGRKTRCEWTTERQTALLRVVLDLEPFLKGYGQKIETWKEVASELSRQQLFQRIGGVDWQGCRRQFERMFDAHRERARTAQKRSGDSEEYSENDQLLDDALTLGTVKIAAGWNAALLLGELVTLVGVVFCSVKEHEEEQKRQKLAKSKRQFESDALDAEIENAAMIGVVDMSRDDTPPEEGQQPSSGKRKRQRRIAEPDPVSGALATYLKEQRDREDRRLELEAKQAENEDRRLELAAKQAENEAKRAENEAKRVENESKVHALMEKMLALLSKQSAE